MRVSAISNGWNPQLVRAARLARADLAEALRHPGGTISFLCAVREKVVILELTGIRALGIEPFVATLVDEDSRCDRLVV